MNVMVAGMAYGDEGKGATVAALTPFIGADTIVRYNGGAQAAHNVVTPEGKHHTFAQFGSGSFTPGVRTYLSKYMMINPVSMKIEAQIAAKVAGLTDLIERVYVDPRALIITPFQRALNRLTEMSRGINRHGSTGMGIGQTKQDFLLHGKNVLTVGDLVDSTHAEKKLLFHQDIARYAFSRLDQTDRGSEWRRELGVLESSTVIEWYLGEYEDWVKKVNFALKLSDLKSSSVIFEGAQGMLLDETYGFHPHTTWSNITFSNAYEILRESEMSMSAHRVGVFRSYFTRHGAGPFQSELSPEIAKNYPEPHNKNQAYTGAFRVGDFDMPMAVYAMHCIEGVDSLAINHLDVALNQLINVRISKNLTVQVPASELLRMIESHLKVPVSIKGFGPTSKDRTIEQGKLCASSGRGSAV